MSQPRFQEAVVDPIVAPARKASPAWLRPALAALALVVVARVLWRTDWARTGALLASVGPRLLLVPLPFLAGMALDTLAWKSILRQIGSAVSYVRLLRMRLGSEAVFLSAPAGAVAAEAVKTVLVAREPRVRTTDALASLAIKKVGYVIAHGLYLVLGFVCGRAAIDRIATALGAGWLPAAYGVVALVMLGLGLGLAASWRLGGPAAFLLRLAGLLPAPRLRRWLVARVSHAHEIDGAVRGFFAQGARVIGPVLGLLLFQWLSEAGETYLMLRLLHVEVSFTAVLAYDASNSFVRSAAFFLPAGLGVQEVGQVLFVHALGVPGAGAVAAALMLMKRAKDLVWIVTGYGLLGRSWRTA
jgi:uncharacterized membrane protein YbhN (UPF0104 family)